MSKAHRLTTIGSRACLVLACNTGLLLACSGGGGVSATSSELQAQTGSLQLKLTARGASGALYRLRDATFQIEQLGVVEPPSPEPFPVPPPRPLPIDLPPAAGGSSSTSGSGGSGGAGGVPGRAGGPAAGGFAGVGTAGSAGAAGASGGGFVTFLSTEDDPSATTLEADLPSGAFLITLLGGWRLERVAGGQVSAVDAALLSPETQDFFIEVNEETLVSYRFQTNGDIVELGGGRLIVDIEVDEGGGPIGGDPRLGVMENAREALPFSLEEVLSAALANAGSALTALEAYHGITESYATAASGRDPALAHCDDELVDGVPSLNGFPLQCGRLEAEQFDNLGAWFPLAAVNRIDLAPTDGASCGQQRLIFANNSPIGNGRMFVILESEIPNPSPECGVAACAPIATFWEQLGRLEDPIERGRRLREAFLSGSPELAGAGFGPFMNARQLGPDGGQIRTNNFNDAPWTLRELQFRDVDQPPLPVPVAESPNGALWNDSLELPQGPACRESFVRAAELGLLTDNLAAMSFVVDEACKDSESRNDFSQDYPSQLLAGSGELSERLGAVGAPFGLSAEELAARARFAGSCMGCHIEAGGSSLGGGLTAPFQFDFVQVSEFGAEPCGNGGTCFAISGALREVFLPHRARVNAQLASGPSCGSPPPEVDPPVVPLPGLGAPTGAAAESIAVGQPSSESARASSVRFTLGGQVADRHAH